MQHYPAYLTLISEIFAGDIPLQPDSSDTRLLFDRLESCSTADEIRSVLEGIEGPWALVYWRHESNQVWFARDPTGRRSLLRATTPNLFALTSVSCAAEPNEAITFVELPIDGLFCVSLVDSFAEPVLFPWSQHIMQRREPRSVTPRALQIEAFAGLQRL
jgi:hypothetical protein